MVPACYHGTLVITFCCGDDGKAEYIDILRDNIVLATLQRNLEDWTNCGRWSIDGRGYDLAICYKTRF